MSVRSESNMYAWIKEEGLFLDGRMWAYLIRQRIGRSVRTWEKGWKKDGRWRDWIWSEKKVSSSSFVSRAYSRTFGGRETAAANTKNMGLRKVMFCKTATRAKTKAGTRCFKYNWTQRSSGLESWQKMPVEEAWKRTSKIVERFRP